jgi:hypothetical protein
MRRRLLLCALATLAVSLGAPPPAGAACGAPQHARAKRDRAPGPPPLAVGDSVMLGALRNLARAGFEVDARVCRQMGEGVDLMRGRRRARSLPRVVVLALGSNWTVTIADIRRALRIAGRDRVLGLVTPREPRGPGSGDAARIRAAGRRWPERVRVLDWARTSSGHASWLAGDGLHLGPAGARAFTRLLSRAFEWAEPSADFSPDPGGGAEAPGGR